MKLLTYPSYQLIQHDFYCFQMIAYMVLSIVSSVIAVQQVFMSATFAALGSQSVSDVLFKFNVYGWKFCPRTQSVFPSRIAKVPFKMAEFSSISYSLFNFKGTMQHFAPENDTDSHLRFDFFKSKSCFIIIVCLGRSIC